MCPRQVEEHATTGQIFGKGFVELGDDQLDVVSIAAQERAVRQKLLKPLRHLLGAVGVDEKHVLWFEEARRDQVGQRLLADELDEQGGGCRFKPSMFLCAMPNQSTG